MTELTALIQRLRAAPLATGSTLHAKCADALEGLMAEKQSADILAALLDIWDDQNNHPHPYDRVYVEGAFREEIERARAVIANPQPAVAAVVAAQEKMRETCARLVDERATALRELGLHLLSAKHLELAVIAIRALPVEAGERDELRYTKEDTEALCEIAAAAARKLAYRAAARICTERASGYRISARNSCGNLSDSYDGVVSELESIALAVKSLGAALPTEPNTKTESINSTGQTLVRRWNEELGAYEYVPAEPNAAPDEQKGE